MPPPANVEYQLDLEIPNEILLKPGDKAQQNLFAYTEDQFKLTLSIFANYHALSEAHLILLDDISMLEEENTLLISSLVKCSETLEEVNLDRQFIYKLREESEKEHDSEIRKQKLKSILFSAGAGVVGVAVGILIGFLVTK